MRFRLSLEESSAAASGHSRAAAARGSSRRPPSWMPGGGRWWRYGCRLDSSSTVEPKHEQEGLHDGRYETLGSRQSRHRCALESGQATPAYPVAAAPAGPPERGSTLWQWAWPAQHAQHPAAWHCLGPASLHNERLEQGSKGGAKGGWVQDGARVSNRQQASTAFRAASVQARSCMRGLGTQPATSYLKAPERRPVAGPSTQQCPAAAVAAPLPLPPPPLPHRHRPCLRCPAGPACRPRSQPGCQGRQLWLPPLQAPRH